MITQKEIEHLAKLARLKLKEEEIPKLTQDLNKILAYVEKINELSLEKLQPLINILENLDLRRDEPQKFFPQEIINNFPEREDNYLKVPKILEK